MSSLAEAYFLHGNQDREDHTPVAALSANEVVLLSASRVGICTTPDGIEAGKLGSLAVSGVFRIKKDNTDTFALHAKVAWDDTANQAEPDGGANDDGTLGIAVKAAVAADDWVEVRINEVPMT
jgi:predicted RecA/RadA family phage recombinase